MGAKKHLLIQDLGAADHPHIQDLGDANHPHIQDLGTANHAPIQDLGDANHALIQDLGCKPHPYPKFRGCKRCSYSRFRGCKPLLYPNFRGCKPCPHPRFRGLAPLWSSLSTDIPCLVWVVHLGAGFDPCGSLPTQNIPGFMYKTHCSDTDSLNLTDHGPPIHAAPSSPLPKTPDSSLAYSSRPSSLWPSTSAPKCCFFPPKQSPVSFMSGQLSQGDVTGVPGVRRCGNHPFHCASVNFHTIGAG